MQDNSVTYEREYVVEEQATRVQALTEGVELPTTPDGKLARTLKFMGETFHTAERIGLMSLLEFAHLSQQGANTNDDRAGAAIYDMLQQCMVEDEWFATEEFMGDVDTATLGQMILRGLNNEPVGNYVERRVFHVGERVPEDIATLPENADKVRVVSEWDRFRAHAKRTRADLDDLMTVVQQAIELMTARPTKPAEVSSPSSSPTSPNSTDVRSRMGLVPVSELLV